MHSIEYGTQWYDLWALCVQLPFIVFYEMCIIRAAPSIKIGEKSTSYALI